MDYLKEAGGGALGGLALIEALRTPGGLQQYVANRYAAQTDPTVREGLAKSPFGAGFYFLGGQRVPAPEGGGLRGPSWQTNLSPEPPEVQAKQLQAKQMVDALHRINDKTATSADYILLGERVPDDVAAKELEHVPGAQNLRMYQYDPTKGAILRAPQPKVMSATGGAIEVTPGSDEPAKLLRPPQARPVAPKPEVFNQAYYERMNQLSKDKTIPLEERHFAKRQVDAHIALQAKEKAASSKAIAEVRFDESQLPVATQNTLAQVRTTRGIIDRLMDLIENDPDVAAGRGIATGRLKNYIYQAGVSQKKGEDAFQSLQAQVGVIGIQPFMRAVKRYEYLQDIRQHLPAPKDQLPLLKTKVNEWRILSLDMERAALEAAAIQRKDIPEQIKGLAAQSQQLEGAGAGQATPTTGGPPASLAPPTPEAVEKAKAALRAAGVEIP